MIRKAVLNDVTAIHSLLQVYNKKGELLSRPLSKLYDHLRDFWVFEDIPSNKVVGCCALQFCWENLAGIRSLAVDPVFTGKGIGSTLTERTIQEAVYFKITDLFTLTYQLSFFEQFGFSAIDKNELPITTWPDCLDCTNFLDRDETILLKKL